MNRKHNQKTDTPACAENIPVQHARQSTGIEIHHALTALDRIEEKCAQMITKTQVLVVTVVVSSAIIGGIIWTARRLAHTHVPP